MKSLKILFMLLMGISQGMAMDDNSFKVELDVRLTSINGKYVFEYSTGEKATYALEELADHKVLIRNLVTPGNKSNALLGILCDLQNVKGYKITAEPDSEVFFCDTVGEDVLLVQHGFRKLAEGEIPDPLVAVDGENIYVRERRIRLPPTLPDGRQGNFKI